MRGSLAVVLLLAACRTPPAKPRVPTPGSGSGIAAGSGSDTPITTTTQPSTNAVVKQFAPRPMIESPHAGPIKLVAVSPDGNAALTVDDIDGLRLWPTLDGTLEPRVVDLVRPKAMALGKLGADRFVAAVLDDVGGLVIATIDGDGRTSQRATIGPDPGFVGVAVLGGNVLAWRADQIVFLIDKDGVALAQLPGEPGERLATILTPSETTAVALVETSGDGAIKRRPRPLVLGARTLAWGKRVDLDEDLGTIVGVSPSGKRVGAVMVDKAKTNPKLVVWDLDKKARIATHPVRFATSVAFVDETHVALIQPNAIEWADLATTGTVDQSPHEPFVAPGTQRAPFGAGPGRVIAPRNDELALTTPTETKYLGYGLESPQVAAVGGNGQLLVGLGETFALLDRELREVSAPRSLVPKQSTISEVRWLGGNDWLVETSGLSDGKTAIAIVDLAKDVRKELRANLPVAQLMMFEPETKLVTFSLGEAPEVARYNADKRTLDKLVSLAKPNGFEQRELIPIAPSLTGGAQILSVQMRDKTTLRWVTGTTAGAIDQGPSVVVDGSLAGFDRAGHAFVWQNGADHKLALAVYDKGKQIGTLPTEGTTTVWPDPKGQRVVLLTGRSVALVALDGTKAWDKPIVGVTEAQWLDDGTLALISAGGLARIDPAKGEITATRCGWRFGLSPTPHPFASRIEPVCVQPR